MEEENTSLNLFKKQKHKELVEKLRKLINNDNFDMDSITPEEATKMIEVAEKLFNKTS